MALRTLYQTLLDSDPARLRVIAEQWAIPLQTTRKADMAAELVAAMASEAAVSRILTALTADQRAALDHLLRHGGAVPWAIVARRWGEVRAVGPGRLEREALWRDPASTTEALWYLGLIQQAFQEMHNQAVEMAFVPEELALYMPPPPDLTIPPPPAAAPPAHQSTAGDTLVDDLVTLWAAVQQTGRLDAPVELIHEPGARRLALLRTLAVEQGWIKQVDQTHVRPAPNPVVAWLKAGAWAQWQSLVQAWRESRTWRDLAHVPELKPDPVNGGPQAPGAARAALLETLAHSEAGAWHTIETIVAYVKRHVPDFLRPDGDYDTWAPRDAATGSPLRGFEAWEAVEGAWITFTITGPMAWLGLVDLGYDAAGDPATTFRLSEAGRALLGLTTPPSDLPAPPPVQVDATGVLRVPPRRRYERFQLSRIAEPEPGVSAAGYRYRLTPASLARAQTQRIPLPRIMTFLQEILDDSATGAGAPGEEAPAALPPQLRAAIEQAYRRREGATIERVWLLRVPDPQWLQTPDLRPLIRRALAPDLALVDNTHRDRVIRILAEKGILTDQIDDP